jgi:hypothetical protein
MESGIFNLTAAQYHADPAPSPSLSSSIANILLDQSPVHAMLAHPRLNASYAREEDSRFDLGSAAHMMLLERNEEKIVRVQADSWRTNAAKAARAQAWMNFQYPVLEHKYADIVEMVKVARAYMLTTELGDILETGAAEQSLLWEDSASGGNPTPFWCRARPDMMTPDVTLDYKSTASASPEFIARQIGRMGYDLQAEFYVRGRKATVGHEVPFVLLFQEITRPYACSLVSLSNAYREVGKLKVARAMTVWDKCLSTGVWPGYTPKILYVEPKPWDLMQAEELGAVSEEDEE